MILVITKNADPTTTTLCYWLINLKKEFKIISEEDDIELIELKKNSILINNISRNYKLDIDIVDKILYRQGDININRNIMLKDKSPLANLLNIERRILHKFIHEKISKIKHFGHPQFADLNKLIILEKASSFDLLVPDYIYTTSKKSVISFKKEQKKIITKTISPGYYYEKEELNYASYTELLSSKDIQNLDSDFYPTFFQKLIEKAYEIRTFYINNEFFSVAIISQSNSKTKIDYRNYDKLHPNRNIPYKLPKEIEKKLKKLIDDLVLKYCSIDLIFGEDGNFYFLEINPIGQFGNVSYFGNYYLEMKMATLL